MESMKNVYTTLMKKLGNWSKLMAYNLRLPILAHLEQPPSTPEVHQHKKSM